MMVANQVTSGARHCRQNGMAPNPQNNNTRPTKTSGVTEVIRDVSAANDDHSSMVNSAKSVDLSSQRALD